VGVEKIALTIPVEPKSGIEAQWMLTIEYGNSKETSTTIPDRAVHTLINDPVKIIVVTNTA
jgi:hypothetical protein